MRKATVTRHTSETQISLALVLDGSGEYDIKSGCGFLDHMLSLFAKHGHFDITLTCNGDTYVDYHHTVEDIGIALGEALREAVGDKAGIARYGSMLLPMDESLVLSAVDLSGRSYLAYDLPLPQATVGDFDTELCEEFFMAFARAGALTLHIKKLDGKNTHHLIEGAFKSVARSLRAAVRIDPEYADELPSTKGVL